ncbi:cytochrome c-type biogenesis protein CcmH [Micromonospora olivasterospora]|uniref:Cytochrome c-type biogenesis protein n=1 Tax=Micromonospora olivasterospora TaxID=1880 RepID=A0A562IFW1_MICOL|nr:cytochrome c-type biogenesis protein CcmH [Micromonospora olivasterospora]TWH69494.1 cytochrome c-type biogenesis protein CcmH/NrfF [Micromonospora olivasterospora]
MRWRRALGALVAAALLAAAGAGLARSAGGADGQDPVRAVAAGLRCPACEGESVADSRSPIAAAMRQAVADQVAQGRDAEEIRRWFVERYGREVLADAPGPAGPLLWAVPALALLGAGYAALRTLRPRAASAAPVPRREQPAGDGRPAADGTTPTGRGTRRAWQACSVGVVALVASVAVAAGRLDRPGARPEPADPVTVAVGLARDLEEQQRYDAAARMYEEALRDRPDDAIRLRLAFALLRAGDSAGAEESARAVLARAPDSPDGLLVLGLAQRDRRSPEAAATLRRFLALAPQHPAAAEIRRLVAAAG